MKTTKTEGKKSATFVPNMQNGQEKKEHNVENTYEMIRLSEPDRDE